MKKYSPKRTLITASAVLDKSENSYVMCVNAGVLYIIRKLLKERGLWRTTYVDSYGEAGYEPATDVQMDQIGDLVGEFIQASEVIEMCNAALLEALQDIADNIRLSSCCYEGGPGVQIIGDEPYFGSETPLDEPTAFGEGEEFATEQAYKDHKCQVANLIIDGLVASLNNLSLLSFVNMTATSVVTGMVYLGILTAPPVAMLMALIAAGLAFGILSSLADEIVDNEEYLVCLLYNSDGAVEAYDRLKSELSELAVDIGVLEVQLGPLANLLMSISPIDTFNRMYQSIGLPDVLNTPVDCGTDCEPCDFTLTNHTIHGEATIITQTSTYVDVQIVSAVTGDGLRHTAYINGPAGVGCDCEFEWALLTGPDLMSYYGEYRCPPPGGLFNIGKAALMVSDWRYGVYAHRDVSDGQFTITARVIL